MGKVPDKMRSRGGEGAIVKELQKAGDVRQSPYMIQKARTSDVDGSCERSWLSTTGGCDRADRKNG